MSEHIENKLTPSTTSSDTNSDLNLDALETKIKGILNSRLFYYFGIGKKDLANHISSLNNLILPNSNTENCTLSRVTQFFKDHIYGKTSIKEVDTLQENLKNTLPLDLYAPILEKKINEITSSYRYKIFGSKKTELTNDLGDLLLKLSVRPNSEIITSLKSIFENNIFYWKGPLELVEKIKKTLDSYRDTPPVANDCTSKSNILIQNNENIQVKPNEITQNHHFQGKIQFQGKWLSVKRGGVDKDGYAVGTGGFGYILYIDGGKEVIKVACIKENKDLKNPKTQEEKLKRQLDKLQKEIDIAQLMYGSKYVLGASAATVTNDAAYIRMECITEGDLFNVLKRKPGTEQKIKYALQALRGLKELHDKGVLYKDLKAENMLVDKEGNLKLIDFGLSEMLKDKPQSFSGTEQYMAPEVLWANYRHQSILESYPVVESAFQEGFTPAADIYNFGVFLSQLLGSLPIEFIAENKRSESRLKTRLSCDIIVTSTNNPNLAKIATDCLKLNPEERPKIDVLISSLEMVLKNFKENR